MQKANHVALEQPEQEYTSGCWSRGLDMGTPLY